jgi:hypothetical protein
MLAVMCFLGCQRSSESALVTAKPATSDTAFYPLQPGWFVVYGLTTTQYQPNKAPVVTDSQRKVRVGSLFTDAAGNKTFRIERFRRANESQPWIADSVGSARWDNNQLIRIENGVSVVGLIVPLVENAYWNPNLYNATATNPNPPSAVLPNLVGDFYQLQHTYQSVVVGKLRFSASVVVRQRADSTLLGQDKRNEIYAFGVGLVYRESVQVRFCYTGDCIGKARIETGTAQQQRILYYGVE